MKESQALGDAQQDESEMEVLLSIWQGRWGPGIRRYRTGWQWRESISTWMTVWKRARHWEMPNRMRVKGKYSYLDDSLEEGQALGDAQQDESEVEENCPKWWHHCRACKGQVTLLLKLVKKNKRCLGYLKSKIKYLLLPGRWVSTLCPADGPDLEFSWNRSEKKHWKLQCKNSNSYCIFKSRH